MPHCDGHLRTLANDNDFHGEFRDRSALAQLLPYPRVGDTPQSRFTSSLLPPKWCHGRLDPPRRFDIDTRMILCRIDGSRDGRW